MRWVTFRDDGDKVGMLHGDRVIPAHDVPDMLTLLAGGAAQMAEAAATLQRSGEGRPVEEVELAAPIPRPPTMRDTLCFLDHLRGCLAAAGLPEELNPAWSQIPAFYFGNTSSVIGPTDDTIIPPGCRWFDFELEVAIVIGKGGRDIDPATAREHIAGYTFFNDWSNRTAQMQEMGLGIGQGKSKDSATTLGPWLVTADEVEAHRNADGTLDLEVSASVNGEPKAKGSLAAMDWSFEEIVAYVSRGTDLVPGEVIGSGTVPRGCLMEHVEPAGTLATWDGWLKAGDVVSLSSPVLGRTENTVVAGNATVHPLHTGA